MFTTTHSGRTVKPVHRLVVGSKGQTAEEQVFDLCTLLKGTELPQGDLDFSSSDEEELEDKAEGQLGRAALAKLQAEIDQLDELTLETPLPRSPRRLHATITATKGPGARALPKPLRIVLPREEPEEVTEVAHDPITEKLAIIRALHLPRPQFVAISEHAALSWETFVGEAGRFPSTQIHLQALISGVNQWLRLWRETPAYARSDWEHTHFDEPSAEILLADLDSRLDQLHNPRPRRRNILWD